MGVHVSKLKAKGINAAATRRRLIVTDPKDDESSLAAKIRATKVGRAAVILPDSSAEFDSPLTLRVLVRAADSVGTNLAIVSGRRQVHYWATIEGITCFSRIDELPRDRKVPGRAALTDLALAAEHSRDALKKGISWIVAASTILLLAGLALALIPREVVTVRPVTAPLLSTVQVIISLNANAPDPTRGILPGRQVFLLVKSIGTIQVSRPDHPPDGHAVGWITIENRTAGLLPLPSGTDVSTYNGAHFVTTQAATLAARPGADVTVPIRAVAAGSASNIQRGEIVVVNGPLHWLVTSVNEEPTAGGGPSGVPIVTPWDTDAVVKQVGTTAHADASRQIQDQLAPGEQSIPAVTDVAPIDEQFTHRIGDESPDLGFIGQFRVSTIIYNQDQMRAMAVQRWSPSIPPGFVLREDSVNVGPATVTSVTSDSVTFNVPIRAVAYKYLNVDRIAAEARFRPASAIAGTLDREYNLAAPPIVAVTPAWIDRALRVAVVVDTGNAPATLGASGQSPGAA